jgi:Tol biopolymer transport system component
MWSGEGFRTDIFIADVASGSVQRFTKDGNDNNEPVWSPDGSTIIFDAGLLGTKDLYMQRLDGGPARLLYRDAGNQFPSDWTPDAKTLLFSNRNQLFALTLDGNATAPVVTESAAGAEGARVSPDGRWLAYHSSATGQSEIYLQAYKNPTQRIVVSQDGGAGARWRRDGRGLYYWHGDQLIEAMLDVPATGMPSVRSRTSLFRADRGPVDRYDVSPDGNQFVLLVGAPRPNRLVIALGAMSSGGASRR